MSLLGIYTVRRSVTNEPLPSPRIISNDALVEFTFPGNNPHIKLNYGAMLFGQYITHDVGNHQYIQNGNTYISGKEHSKH